MLSLETMPEVDISALVRYLLDRRTIRPAGEVAIKVHHMRIRPTSLIPSHGQAGDQSTHPHLATGIHVGHFTHYEETAHDLHEIAFFAKALEIGVMTEQCA